MPWIFSGWPLWKITTGTCEGHPVIILPSCWLLTHTHTHTHHWSYSGLSTLVSLTNLSVSTWWNHRLKESIASFGFTKRKWEKWTKIKEESSVMNKCFLLCLIQSDLLPFLLFLIWLVLTSLLCWLSWLKPRSERSWWLPLCVSKKTMRSWGTLVLQRSKFRLRAGCALGG